MNRKGKMEIGLAKNSEELSPLSPGSVGASGYFSTLGGGGVATRGGVATPLVKMRSENGGPRVQMFRTRVVYSDSRDGGGGGGVPIGSLKGQEASV